MKGRTQQLLEQVEKAHDFDEGQVWGHGGTAYSSTDTCRICGLQRKYFSDSQNGVSARYTFANIDGEEVRLLDATECK